MVKIPGKLIVEKDLMQSILLYLQEQPYKEVAGLITNIIALNVQLEEPKEKPKKK
jgi:hypothetical protein